MAPNDDRIAGAAQDLRGEVSKLNAGVLALAEAEKARAEAETARAAAERVGRRTRRVVAGLAFSLLLDFGLTGYVIYTNHQLNEVQERTNNKVLCPLYRLILSAYHPERQTPDALPEYQRVFGELRVSANALDCPDIPDKATR